MRTRTQIAWSALFILGLASAGNSAQTEHPLPTENIVARMAEAGKHNRAHFRPYVVTRDYKLLDKETVVPTAQVIAELTFVPPYLRSYTIQHANGIGMGERIVRRMLEGQMAFAEDSGSTDISPGNYDFRLLREEDVNGRRFYVLELSPRRKAKNLLRGNIWVDTQTYLVHRVEGEPAKSSSWWLRDVRIVLLFGYVGDMWLQTSSESTANVRIVGKYKITSQDVSYKFDQTAPVRAAEQSAFFPAAASEAPNQ